MRGGCGILVVVCASTSLAACSRPQGQLSSAPVSPVSDGASAAQVVGPEAGGGTEPPAESSLSIKRGLAMLAQDRATFRPCDENVELWLLDQTDGVLAQTFGSEARNTPVTLYIEAYGERAPVAEDIPAARAYGGTFLLEEVLYAGVQGEVRGCDLPIPDYIVAARGTEPFWAVEVSDTRMLWRQPEEPREIDLGMPQMEDSEGAVRYHASSGAHQLELMIDTQPCRDAMSGELFAYSAKVKLDGKELTGCARVGP
jgi:uncharacterized membrane protein